MVERVNAEDLKLSLSVDDILDDYRLAYSSRQASYAGQREVMSGKAKFGIFGAGKELPQLAMARVFQDGDFRSGYYRDQTFMFATGMLTLEAYFAQLYAHADVEADPATAGRAMNAHFATRSLNEDSSWKDLTAQPNSSADVSPTASQMPRVVGLAYASKLYRSLEELKPYKEFSNNGNEVAFGTIGDASSAEGLFWESVNAIGVLRSPAILTIYDDGYGISVTQENQIAKDTISELLSGFERPPDDCCDGYDIYMVYGWDYPSLIETFQRAAAIAREEHMPSIIHVNELTQPQGHSTSGSHERYKTPARLEWEAERDCVKRFRQWIIEQGIASAEILDELEASERDRVNQARKNAWLAYIRPIQDDRKKTLTLLAPMVEASTHREELGTLRDRLANIAVPWRRDIAATIHEALILSRHEESPARQAIIDWRAELEEVSRERYSTHLYSEGEDSALNVPEIQPQYSDASPTLYGYEILNACFDAALAREPRLIAFGEDVGYLGDVNQAMRGMQQKYGSLRVTDTGIREATILGQSIGMAMRGLRPLAEIQYLDYLLYALQLLSDDLATLRWRTKSGQKAPVILRTRGHRLEGIWHSGSPMAGVIHLVRGVHVITPRDMTRAAGFYNTLLKAEEPAIVVEVLSGYRLKETLPDNIGEFTIPLGTPEILRQGDDVTLVTYGACCRIVMSAAEQLSQVGIEAEVIDVQTLLPFDLHASILDSLKKTGRILFIDEDVPGGTTAYMLQEVLEKQGGFSWLDSPPGTISSQAHRPAYGSDGDYWSKPNAEQVFQKVYDTMHEVDPRRYPIFYR